MPDKQKENLEAGDKEMQAAIDSLQRAGVFFAKAAALTEDEEERTVIWTRGVGVCADVLYAFGLDENENGEGEFGATLDTMLMFKVQAQMELEKEEKNDTSD